MTDAQTPNQWQVLYGAGDGSAWLVLRGQYGRLPPEKLDELPLLGDIADVMRDVLDFRMRASRASRAEPSLEVAQRVHGQLADELGITPKYLTDCINCAVIPELSSRGWSRLAKAVHFTRGG
jgi:hypothetical protein